MPGALFHVGYELEGVGPGGKHVYVCKDCDTKWVQTHEEECAPPVVIPPIHETHRVIEPPGGPEQKVEPLPVGNGANQVLLDTLKRVAAGKTTWVAVVEIGPAGIPAASWSDGPMTFCLAAANAFVFETHARLASYVSYTDDPDGPDDEGTG